MSMIQLHGLYHPKSVPGPRVLMISPDIHISSLSNPHADLPPGIHLFAQLIVEDLIINETMAVTSETDQNWTLTFTCDLPEDTTAFCITILGIARCSRLLGSVKITRDEAFLHAEQQKSFSAPLAKVNSDGPTLNFSTLFSGAAPADQISLDEDENMGTPIGSLDRDTIACQDGNRGMLLNQLGEICLEQSQQFHVLDMFNRGVCAYLDAIREGFTETTTFAHLGITLFQISEETGEVGDLADAISAMEKAVQGTADTDTDKPSWLANLGGFHVRQFERVGNLDDLNSAISIGEQGMHLAAEGHDDWPIILNNLSTALHLRFQQQGDPKDLSRSLQMGEQAVKITADEDPNKLARLSNLGDRYLTLFELEGQADDLEKSIHFATTSVDLASDDEHMNEEAVLLTLDGQPAKPKRLSALAVSLLTRFEIYGGLSDLDESVERAEQAVQLTGDENPSKPLRMDDLAGSLLRRFERLGNREDIDQSISNLDQALSLLPESNKPFILNSLSNSLLLRFKQQGDVADLERAFSVQESAVNLASDGHHDKPSLVFNFGNISATFFNHSQMQDHLAHAIIQYTAAALSKTGPVDIQFDSAAAWAQCATVSQHPSLLDAYNRAIQLLPQLAWLGISIPDRHHQLLKAGKVVRDAAAAAIMSGHSERAVEWLEEGRSIIWGQILKLRTPLDTLKEVHPELAERLLNLSSELQQSGMQTGDLTTQGSTLKQPLIIEHSHQKAQEREKLIQKILVLLNISGSNCDALVLRPAVGGVLHVPLLTVQPGLPHTLVQSLDTVVRGVERLKGKPEGHQDADQKLGKILSDLWVNVVKPVLNALNIQPRKSELGRIWWCPTGGLAFLPIHAAGLYGKHDTFGSKLSDFLISSYTPSLTALMESFRPSSTSPKPTQLLSVAQASVAGMAYLPGTEQEIKHIHQLAQGSITIMSLNKDKATATRVEQGMLECRWAHFACHGEQNLSHPTDSALLLASGTSLTLSRIIQLALPDAEFAFLSACQTATGEKSLEEEAVHLAAGMLLAGYRGVIATMWKIRDDDAPQVAHDVYEYLFSRSPPDATEAAVALHKAIQKLRESPNQSLSRWVPFIHVGH
ncbi:CHAT domain-containing protein [Roridomyces roridus]|uniref:CHAT domain-containing protein n=1 Tax=Roridomyces roridus TaxID=1738132 RepID=A0AAD7FIG7_9AGAR|nr:CHAT domain-containing protein [Roridomyces roridus]